MLEGGVAGGAAGGALLGASLAGLSVALLLAGCFFFLAGTVGLLRFPDFFCRLHALTKADNLGLGCVAAGLALQADSWAERGQLLMVWLLALLAAATVCHLLARLALGSGVRPLEGGSPSSSARAGEEAP